jgi:transcriptional regulator with XRE-family HTH domain
MPKSLIRIIGFLLIPCLLADSVRPSLAASFGTPDSLQTFNQSLPINKEEFQSQALTAAAAEMINPLINNAKIRTAAAVTGIVIIGSAVYVLGHPLRLSAHDLLFGINGLGLAGMVLGVFLEQLKGRLTEAKGKYVNLAQRLQPLLEAEHALQELENQRHEKSQNVERLQSDLKKLHEALIAIRSLRDYYSARPEKPSLLTGLISQLASSETDMVALESKLTAASLELRAADQALTAKQMDAARLLSVRSELDEAVAAVIREVTDLERQIKEEENKPALPVTAELMPPVATPLPVEAIPEAYEGTAPKQTTTLAEHLDTLPNDEARFKAIKAHYSDKPDVWIGKMLVLYHFGFRKLGVFLNSRVMTTTTELIQKNMAYLKTVNFESDTITVLTTYPDMLNLNTDTKLKPAIALIQKIQANESPIKAWSLRRTLMFNQAILEHVFDLAHQRGLPVKSIENLLKIYIAIEEKIDRKVGFLVKTRGIEPVKTITTDIFNQLYPPSQEESSKEVAPPSPRIEVPSPAQLKADDDAATEILTKAVLDPGSATAADVKAQLRDIGLSNRIEVLFRYVDDNPIDSIDDLRKMPPAVSVAARISDIRHALLGNPKSKPEALADVDKPQEPPATPGEDVPSESPLLHGYKLPSTIRDLLRSPRSREPLLRYGKKAFELAKTDPNYALAAIGRSLGLHQSTVDIFLKRRNRHLEDDFRAWVAAGMPEEDLPSRPLGTVAQQQPGAIQLASIVQMIPESAAAKTSGYILPAAIRTVLSNPKVRPTLLRYGLAAKELSETDPNYTPGQLSAKLGLSRSAVTTTLGPRGIGFEDFRAWVTAGMPEQDVPSSSEQEISGAIQGRPAQGGDSVAATSKIGGQKDATRIPDGVPILPTEKWTGAMVRAARESKNWTRPDLAALAGVHKDTIKKIESGERGISDEMRQKLMNIFGNVPALEPLSVVPELKAAESDSGIEASGEQLPSAEAVATELPPPSLAEQPLADNIERVIQVLRKMADPDIAGLVYKAISETTWPPRVQNAVSGFLKQLIKDGEDFKLVRTVKDLVGILEGINECIFRSCRYGVPEGCRSPFRKDVDRSVATLVSSVY